MQATTKMFILKSRDFHEELDAATTDKLTAAGAGRADMGHGRIIVEAPIAKADDVRQVLEDEFDDLGKLKLVEVDMPLPSGKMLAVNFQYRETDQICTANVDERLWAVMTRAEDPGRSDEEKEADAFAALYEDVEIAPHYVPGRDIDVQDVMSEVTFWTPDHMVFDNAFWDADEPMAQITFIAQAEPADGGNFIEVRIPETGTSTASWGMPVRLLPEVDPQTGHDGLALLPCAPAFVRKWAAVAPFEIEVTLPEPDLAMEP